MAIVEMQKLSICANKKHRKKVLETLQNLGVMEVDTVHIDDPDLKKMDTASMRNTFVKSAESFDRALKLLAAYAPENRKGIAALNGRDPVARAKLSQVVDDRQKYLDDMTQVLHADKEMTECRGNITKDETMIAALSPWLKLGVPLGFTGTKTTAALIGTLPDPITDDALYAQASAGLEEPVCVSAEVISSSNEMTCISVLCLKRDEARVEENLRTIGFARPAQLANGIPRELTATAETDIEAQKKKISELESEIASFGKEREEFRIAADYYRTRAEKYKLLGTIPQSEKCFFLEGWVTKDKADRVAKLLTERYGALVETEKKADDEMEPTVLHNNRFSEPAEAILESYGLPQHGRVDPTCIMSIFYVIFFGMMLSDAGYGILMFITCAILLKKYTNMDSGLKRMLKLFFWCGLSTTFWGFMYGGFFGDAIDTVAKTFFGCTGDTILKPLWFEPLSNPMRLLVWCMLFGVIHLYTGLGIKGYEMLKSHDVKGFICDIVSWYMFLTGLIFLLLPSDLFASISGMSFHFPAFVGQLSKWVTIIGMVIILLMSGRGRKNWALRIALGAYDLYGVTSWLSDVLSYSRLLALGLATGVIANVINLMASMFGGGVVGAILFVVIFIFGHLLNIGINALGAYVHTNRLQYVEFFGKFYDAGGRPFKPFHTEDKYIEIKEEQVL